MKKLNFFSLLFIPVCIFSLMCLHFLKAADKNPPLPGNALSLPDEPSITFVVMGDTRTPGGLKPPAISPHFIQMRNEINILNPDFVLDVGDLIRGYIKADQPQDPILDMWKEYDKAIKEFKPPFIQVVGNHDVWDARSKKIYEGRYGALYHSWNYQGYHFISLSSEDLDTKQKPMEAISDEQLQWLAKDLEANKDAKQILVFLHKPFWYVSKNGAPWLEKVHPLLKKYPVTAVFAGHDHVYNYSIRDGINYVVTGGGGAEVGGEEEAGAFYHYCQVRLRGKSLSVAVIKKDSILPIDCVSTESYLDYKKLSRVKVSIVPSPGNKPGEITFQTKLVNPDKEVVFGKIVCRSAPVEVWQVEHATPQVELSMNQEKILPVTFRAKDDRQSLSPLFEAVLWFKDKKPHRFPVKSQAPPKTPVK